MDGNCGPSVMVWGAIHQGRRSELVVLNGTFNRQCHTRLLCNNMFPRATGVYGRNFVYVCVRAMLRPWQHGTRLLSVTICVMLIDWSAQSSDMNPIAHTWDQRGVWIRDLDDPTCTVQWISNYIHYKVWDEITYPFLNFNGCTVEV